MREVVVVSAFGLVQLQRRGESIEDALREPAQVAALQPGLVVDADARQQRHLITTEPGHPAVAAIGGQPGLVRSDLGPADYELKYLAPVIHALDSTGAAAPMRDPVVT